MPLHRTRPFRRSGLILIASAALGFTSLTAPAAAGDGSSSGMSQAGNATVAAAEQTVPDLDEYWTPERMRAAKPIPAPADPTGAHAPERIPGPHPSSHQVLREAGPVIPEDSAKALRDVSTMADDISVSQEWPGPTTSWPLNIVGKLFVTLPDGSAGQCSASVIISDTESALWTAAHCLHEGENNEDGFYSNVTFAPAYRGGETPWGLWNANQLIVPTSWADGDIDRWLDADMGSVVLDPLEPYGKIQDAMGAFGYKFSFDTDYSDVFTFGYPSEGYQRPDSDFRDGQYLMFCYGNTEDALPGIPLDNRLEMDCDMGEGSSGGPYLIGYPNGIQIVGANSHTEGKGADRRNDDLYSAEHANHAAAVIDAVNALDG